MLCRRIFAVGGAMIVLSLVSVAAAPAVGATTAGTTVSVRVEGVARTLLSTTVVRTHGGSITRGGTPAGDCPATTAAGALDVAAHHRWTGTFSSSVRGIFITSIFGEKPAGHDYWEIFVNNRPASLGICGLKLRRGDQLLFADTNGSENPLVLTAPRHATTGHPFQVKVSYESPKGVLKPLAGVTVKGAAGVTNRRGIATVTATRRGKLTLSASRAGYIRSARVTVPIA